MPKHHDVLTRRLAGLAKFKRHQTTDPWGSFAKQLVREESIDDDLASLYSSKPREAVRRALDRVVANQLAPRKTVEAWLDAYGEESLPTERWVELTREQQRSRIEGAVSAAALRDREELRKGEDGEFKSTLPPGSRLENGDLDRAVDGIIDQLGMNPSANGPAKG
jgi:hypothetical protein